MVSDYSRLMSGLLSRVASTSVSESVRIVVTSKIFSNALRSTFFKHRSIVPISLSYYTIGT